MSIALYFFLIFPLAQSATSTPTVYISELVDTNDQWNIDSLLTDVRQKAFDQSPKTRSYYGYEYSPHWYKITISPSREKTIIQVNSPGAYDLLLYRPDSLSTQPIARAGRKYPIEEWAMKDRNMIFPVGKLTTSTDFYLRVQETASLIVPIEVFTEPEHKVALMAEQMGYGIFYGFIGAMLIYNLMLFLFLKDITYLYYVLSMLAAAGVSLVRSGYAIVYLWPEDASLDGRMYLIFAGLSMMASSRMVSHFLQFPKTNRRLDLYFWFISFLCLVMVALSFFFTFTELTNFGRIIVLIAVPSFLVLGTIAWIRKNSSARFLVLAWLPYITGTVIIVFKGAGWIDYHPLIHVSAEIGFMLEAMLLSLALADRISAMRKSIAAKEREKLELSAKILAEQQVILQKTVNDRTQELKASNSAKDKMFAIISHDLRGSITSFKGIGEVIDFHLNQGELMKVKSIAKNIDNNADHLNNLLDNLLNWSVVQMGKHSFKKESLDLQQQLKDIRSAHLELARNKGIEITLQTNGHAHLMADKNGLLCILRNLISNAIKYSQPGGAVFIDCEMQEHEVCLQISDTGVGMSPQQMDSLFELSTIRSNAGTAGEQGTGLGLILCKHFIDLHKAKLDIKSKVNKGSCFTVYFPNS